MKPLLDEELAILKRPWSIISRDQVNDADRLMRRGLLDKACGDYFITEKGRLALATAQ